MARGPIPYLVLKTNGDATPGASAQVNLRGAGAATVFANETGGTTIANPVTTDSEGRIPGWLDEGSYDVTVSGTGITTATRALEVLKGGGTFAEADGSITTVKIVDANVTTPKLADASVTLAKQDAASNNQYPPIGAIIAYTGQTLPSGTQWDWADGGLIDKTTFATFFSQTGHAYNGGVDPGANKVRKPDRRGRSGIGAINFGAGAGTNDNAHHQGVRGVSYGEVLHTLIAAEGSVNASGTTGIENAAHLHGPTGANADFMGNALVNFGFEIEYIGTQTNQGVAWNGTTATQNANHIHGFNGRTADSAHNTVHPSESSNYLVRVL